MADTRIEYRHPRSRGLTTVWAVLRNGPLAVKVADGSLAALADNPRTPFAHPLTDVDVPYLYVRAPHANTPPNDYALEVYQSQTAGPPVVYDDDDALIGEGVFVWRGPSQTLATPGSGTALIHESVEADLGGSGADIELAAADYMKCLAAAVRELNRARPQRAWAVLPYVHGTQRYLVTHPTLIGILDVQFLDQRYGCGEQVIAVVTPFGNYEPQGLNILTQPMPGDTPGITYMAGEYAKSVQMMVGPDQSSWQARQEQGGLFLYISAAQGTKVSYEYAWGITPDDNAGTGVSYIPPGDLQWVIDFTRARAKQILGRVRNKFGGINLPGGGSDQVDGEALLQEGQAEEAALKEELRSRRRPGLPDIG